MKRLGFLRLALIAYVVLAAHFQEAGGSCGGGAQADMVFILDASGSVGSGNFQSMLRFVRDLVDTFSISSNEIHVGVQKYSHVTNTEFKLNQYYDKNAMKTRIMAIYYTSGGTNTAAALAYCRTTMFTSGNGDRANVPNIAIVITDGVSYPYPGTEARNLRDTGATIFSVGIGSGIPLGELNEMATDPDSDHVFAVSGFSALNNIKSAFQTQACPDPCKVDVSLKGEYKYVEVSIPGAIDISKIDIVYFWVKTCNDAHLVLSNHKTSWKQGTTMYEIVIGGWSNTKSVIRLKMQGAHMDTEIHSYPVNCNAFNRYYVGWGNDTIQVGYDKPDPNNPGKYKADPPFMSYKNPNPFDINHLFISAWPNAPAEWKFNYCQRPVNGAWSNWGPYNSCSKSCGSGTYSRTRTCSNPAPAHGGTQCSGSTSQTSACNTQACPVHGKWGGWGGWGSCSKTCGGGTKTRTRACSSPSPAHGGNQCSGASSESTSCNSHSCSACAANAQVDVVFILDASGSVGSGNFQLMLQFVRDLVGTFDVGSSKIRVGVQKYSSGTNTEFNLKTYYDKNAMKTRIMQVVYTGGGTNTGGALSYCRTNMFTTANGDRAGIVNVIVVLTDGRSNNYQDTADQAKAARDLGFRIFSVGIGSGIPLGELNEMATDPDSDHVFAVSNFNALQGIKTAFGNKACAPTNGKWGQWGSYGTCTRTCGGGTKTRTRKCNSPPPSNGGANCAGSSSDSAACGTASCAVNGNWGSWGSWASCTKTCNTGSKTRTRRCDNPAPLHGGAQCPGSSSSTTTCFLMHCPINGGWTVWSAWGTCSTTCELGSWSRSRSCTNPAPAHGGAQCSGTTGQTTSCNLRPCPVDGAWSAWQSWGACSVTCMGVGVRSRIRDCDNPTPLHGGKQCPGAGTESQSCDKRLTLCSVGNGWAVQVYSTTAGTPVNGGMGLWGAWTTCTKSCGAGTRLRTRRCNNPVPKFGGAECSGDYTEKEVCGNIPCPGGSSYTQSCPDRYFDCASGNITCIHYLKKCDCRHDCDDGSDEDVEYAGCMAENSVCSNRATRVVYPETLTVTLVSIVAASLPWLLSLLATR